MPKKTSSAKTAPPPVHAPDGALRAGRRGETSWLVVAVGAVVVMVAVTVPLGLEELNVTVAGESVQAGTSTAPEGLLVRAQLVREAVPA